MTLVALLEIVAGLVKARAQLPRHCKGSQHRICPVVVRPASNPVVIGPRAHCIQFGNRFDVAHGRSKGRIVGAHRVDISPRKNVDFSVGVNIHKDALCGHGIKASPLCGAVQDGFIRIVSNQIVTSARQQGVLLSLSRRKDLAPIVHHSLIFRFAPRGTSPAKGGTRLCARPIGFSPLKRTISIQIDTEIVVGANGAVLGVSRPFIVNIFPSKGLGAFGQHTTIWIQVWNPMNFGVFQHTEIGGIAFGNFLDQMLQPLADQLWWRVFSSVGGRDQHQGHLIRCGTALRYRCWVKGRFHSLNSFWLERNGQRMNVVAPIALSLLPGIPNVRPGDLQGRGIDRIGPKKIPDPVNGSLVIVVTIVKSYRGILVAKNRRQEIFRSSIRIGGIAQEPISL
mmetsp:Transcript_4927/g.10239  ORF Transcript_4927/g.10239 Transcript_4927/m.10239 type:complete len:395 (+) Transcript_4927:1208-2392(+)